MGSEIIKIEEGRLLLHKFDINHVLGVNTLHCSVSREYLFSLQYLAENS